MIIYMMCYCMVIVFSISSAKYFQVGEERRGLYGVYSTCQVNIILIHVDDMKQRNSKNVISRSTKESIAVLNNSQQEMFINMSIYNVIMS